MDVMVRAGILAAVLAAAGAGAQAPPPAGTPAAPRQMLRVEATTVDAGVVTGGETVRATFVFHNDGDRPVRILRAKPG